MAPTLGSQKSKERGSELGVWMEAQRRNSAAGVGWSGLSPKGTRGVDPARATWEPS